MQVMICLRRAVSCSCSEDRLRLWLGPRVPLRLGQALTHQPSGVDDSFGERRFQTGHPTSGSITHSALDLLKALPLFSLSMALLLPAYVGLISFPISSMMASSSAYLF